MSPYEIKLLLDIYALPDFIENHKEPMLDRTLRDFYRQGLIDSSELSPQLTGMGRAHVIQLCNLLYPVEQKFWADQFGNKIPDTI